METDTFFMLLHKSECLLDIEAILSSSGFFYNVIQDDKRVWKEWNYKINETVNKNKMIMHVLVQVRMLRQKYFIYKCVNTTTTISISNKDKNKNNK